MLQRCGENRLTGRYNMFPNDIFDSSSKLLTPVPLNSNLAQFIDHFPVVVRQHQRTWRLGLPTFLGAGKGLGVERVLSHSIISLSINTQPRPNLRRWDEARPRHPMKVRGRAVQQSRTGGRVEDHGVRCRTDAVSRSTLHVGSSVRRNSLKAFSSVDRLVAVVLTACGVGLVFRYFFMLEEDDLATLHTGLDTHSVMLHVVDKLKSQN